MIRSINEQLNQPKIDWNTIYFDIQSAGISDPRFHSKNFHKCPIWVIREMRSRIDHRDTTLANAYSMAAARIGVAWAPKGTPLQYFLPFLLEEDKKTNDITVDTAKIFIDGVKSHIIPNKVISAFGKHIDKIYELVKD